MNTYNIERFIETLEEFLLFLQQKINEATNGQWYDMNVLQDLDSKVQAIYKIAIDYLKSDIYLLYSMGQTMLEKQVQDLFDKLNASDSDTFYIFYTQIFSLKAMVGTLE
ncbi:hypothetical protein LCY76_09445 [Fictibacillus sp. KIGAM418]|uniref:Uncharacterized protein n=1 Tax=Fictibacillus marinisediminis TaxID=2878389 RepID=A0A9X1X9Q8_9BACL|nr:hypothetical protein [Fictibacillus marinisediminis]MCK6256817.1 hypothetical protein [Fictibacillus marinisediminis]